MNKNFIKRFSLVITLIFICTLVPAGFAQAYYSVSDYYSKWSKFGIEYKNTNTTTQPENNAAEDNTDTPEVPDTTNNQPVYTSKYDYYKINSLDYYNKYKTNNTPDPGGEVNIPDNNTENPGNTPTPEPAPPEQDNDTGETGVLSAQENQMLNLVNQERRNAGLAVFKVDSRLVELARKKSRDMYENHYFSHTSPTYGTAYDMERDAGISARVMGAENIARAATVTRAHELFMNSDGHRANILDSRHDTIGIGIANSPGGVYVTQLFLGD